MTATRTFVMYGAGGDDPEAWPVALRNDRTVTFLRRPDTVIGDDPVRDAERLLAAIQGGSGGSAHVVAVSYGGIAAVLAAAAAPAAVTSLVLLEPSCASLAPEAASVRDLRRSLDPLLHQLRRRNAAGDDDDLRAAIGAVLQPGASGTDAIAAAPPLDRLRATPAPGTCQSPAGRSGCRPWS